jgi:TPR repeat protein
MIFFPIGIINAGNGASAYSLTKLEKEASKGDVWSQYWMGRTYEDGRLLVKPDTTVAFGWYLKAAKQNQVESQFRVAYMYYAGLGVTKNEKEFLYWLKTCAASPKVTSTTNLARINLAKVIGLGLFGEKQDINYAISMLENLPETKLDVDWKYIYESQSHLKYKEQITISQFDEDLTMLVKPWCRFREILPALHYRILGQLYDKGAAINNYDANCYKQSALNYEKEAQSLKGLYYTDEYKRMQGNAWANAALEWLFYGTFTNDSEYKVHLIEAVKRGAYCEHTGMIYMLGEANYFGEYGLAVNKEEGVKWLLKSARSKAVVNVGGKSIDVSMLSLTGNGGKWLSSHAEEAFKIQWKSAYILGNHYYEDTAYSKSMYYFKEIADKIKVKESTLSDEMSSVMADALKKISTMYRFGRGVDEDESLADYYLSRAARLGDPDASKIQKWLQSGVN